MYRNKGITMTSATLENGLFNMPPRVQKDMSILALIANLIVSGATLSYVRETEHRITLVETRVALLLCEAKPTSCQH